MSNGDHGAWIQIAEEDLAAAKKLASPPAPQWKTAVYHCQQAAEKAIKALLVLHGGALTKKLEKHDIGLLLDKLSAYTMDLGDLDARAESLTDFASMYRYPNSEVEPLTQEIVDRAIVDAEIFLNRSKQFIATAENEGVGDAGGATGGPQPRNRGVSGPK